MFSSLNQTSNTKRRKRKSTWFIHRKHSSAVWVKLGMDRVELVYVDLSRVAFLNIRKWLCLVKSSWTFTMLCTRLNIVTQWYYSILWLNISTQHWDFRMWLSPVAQHCDSSSKYVTQHCNSMMWFVLNSTLQLELHLVVWVAATMYCCCSEI